MTPQQKKLVEDHIGWVKMHACRIAKTSNLPACVSIDDLLSYGCLGLMEAAQRFDPSRGTLFTTFARRRVRGSMLDGLRKADWLPRNMRQEVKGSDRLAVRHISLSMPILENGRERGFVSDLLEAPGSDSSHSIAERAEMVDLAMRKVHGKHRVIIQKYFFEHKTMAEIGEELGLSESRISQKMKEVLEMIREALGVKSAGGTLNHTNRRGSLK